MRERLAVGTRVDGGLHAQNVTGEAVLGRVAGVERSLQPFPCGEEPLAVVADDAPGGVGTIQVVEFEVRIRAEAPRHLRQRHLDDLRRAFHTAAHPGSFFRVVGGDDEEQRPVLGEQPTFEAAQARICHSQHPQYR